MSLEYEFGDGHTVDIGPVVGPDQPLQGVWLQIEYSIEVDTKPYAIYRVIGITRAEMAYKHAKGSKALARALKRAGVYLNTLVGRASVV